ncbi:Threonine/homoserine efflux transporter RhtA [Arenibacter palladensis]|uniref:Threonine/homoserine efflux transporter RhtA n=1 Tax=Arenibacter palladensis TaxID=237373 RepID=A0A1M4UY43_9FLAO|nr:DMT family transporter [Arenibacter palladensis]MDO6601406.1 DMT family transporter [Arenibacter palladensis]SHE61671.1 Threonine/homoserine efflux transporter RhtA [Arenibacter palladensis]
MSRRTLAILAALGATTIYGINHTIAKGVMPTYVKPFGFIFLRLFGASLLFWGISFFGPKEKLERRDWGRLLVCAFFGMGINMLSFFKGLDLSTPINSAVLITITPILVVILSALFIKEKITLRRGMGVFMGLIGALALILFGAEIRQDATNIPLGNLLFIVNATSYGLYLILVKKLLEKYHPFTLMKWMFGIGFFITLPITYSEFTEIQWSHLPIEAIGAIAFVIIGTTFLTYLFNVFALTQLKASTVGVFMYLQPLIGIIFAIVAGKDHLTLVKFFAIVLVLIGVYLVSKKVRPGP